MQVEIGAALAEDQEPGIGFADFVAGATVTGWAIDLRAIGEPLLLQATIDGVPVGDVRCTLPREDIRGAGIPTDSGGFCYVIPPDFADGRQHVLRLELPDGSPIRFPSEDGAAHPQHVFSIPAADAQAGCTDIADLLRDQGITCHDFIKLFDVGDYIALNSTAGLTTSAQCVGHFARLGRKALCPIAIEWRFDPGFYAQLADDAACLPPEQAYLHWLNVGLPGDIRPNRSLFLKSLGLRRLDRMPPGFDAAIYRALNPDLAAECATEWAALRHAIHHGIPARRPGCPPPEQGVELYLAAADRLAVANRLDEAKRIYEQVVSAEPAHPSGLQHYGDCLLRMDDHYAAEQMYLRVAAVGAGTIWTDLNLAKCRTRAGRGGAAARGLADLRRRLPGDVSVARQAAAAADSCFMAWQSQARQLAASGFLAEGRARMAQAASLLTQGVQERLPDPPLAGGPIRTVSIVADLSLAQCKFYRVEQKLEQLAAAGIAAQVHDQLQPLDRFAQTLRFVDAVIFYRVAATPPIVAAIEAARAAGVVTFYEIDDLIFDPEHFPDSLASYGGLISPEVYGDLVTGTELFRAAMSLCDYALASTPALAARMQPQVRARQAFVHRNALGNAHLRQAQLPHAARRTGPVRIFYGTGTRAGNEDFERLAAPALDRLLKARGNAVELFLLGHLALPDCLARHAARIHQMAPIWDLESYWSILAPMDINLAVLKDSVLSDCKSEIKWLEAAMLGVPSVVSPTATYREVIEDGVTGLFAATAEDWWAALDRLVRDAALRQRIGHAAREHALRAYGPAASADGLRRMFAAVQPVPAAPPGRRRVLVVNVFFPPQDIGGATRVVADNVRDLMRDHRDEFEIEVFTTTEGGAVPYSMRSHVWNGVRVTAVTASNGERPDWEPDDPRMAELFGQVLDRFQPDLVHFHCIQRLTGAVCRATQARGIPYLVTVHDGWWISDHQFLLDDALQPSRYRHGDHVPQFDSGGHASLRRMRMLACHLAGARAVLAVSEPFARLYRDCGLRNVRTVANGVPDFALAPRTVSSDGRVRLGHLGGAAPHKGYNLLKTVLATERFTNLSLTMIDHALQPGVERSDVWGSVPVRCRAKSAQAEVGRLYAELDVLVAPSLWPESFGLVAREALHAGCWVIASDRGAMGDDVTPANGFVIDVGSPDGLRQALARIDADPDRYRAPPAATVRLRHSREQARELAALYRGSDAPATTAPPDAQPGAPPGAPPDAPRAASRAAPGTAPGTAPQGAPATAPRGAPGTAPRAGQRAGQRGRRAASAAT